jgi:hypothetical protein
MLLKEEDLPYKVSKIKPNIKQDILFKLELLDKMLIVANESLELYILGGAGCIITDMVQRSTLDIDIIDIGYKSVSGKYMNIIEPLDILEFSHTTVPPGFKKRAFKIKGYRNLDCYILAPEDIIVSKLCRYNKKDKEDIKNILLKTNDKKLIVSLKEMNDDIDKRIDRIRENYQKNIIQFKKDFGIDV